MGKGQRLKMEISKYILFYVLSQDQMFNVNRK